jgi:hypothetical protein
MSQIDSSISNYKSPFGVNINSVTPLAKPIEKVQESLETVSDTFIPTTDEKNTKIKRNAIAAGASVLVLTGFVMLLNPSFSPKIIDKLKKFQFKAENKVTKNEGKTFSKYLYTGFKNIVGGALKCMNVISNGNSFKDVKFQQFCTKKHTFSTVKNKTAQKILTTIDNGIVSVMKKPHQTITKWFDNISKKTVSHNYKRANKKINSFEQLVEKYKTRLTPENKTKIEQKLFEIKNAKTYFSEESLQKRLTEQEVMMKNLETEFQKKIDSYANGFANQFVNKSEHINKNLSFWAQDIVHTQKEIVEKNGNDAVGKIIGNSNGEKGLYNEVIEILKGDLTPDELKYLNSSLNDVKKSINTANISECSKYFDKKRDLMLGSAPTDIVTAIASLIMSGIVIGRADTKEERISKSITGVFPVVAGVGASLAFTSMLFAGPKSIAMAALTSTGLSAVGHVIKNKLFGDNTEDNTENSNKEVVNA